MNFSLLLRTNDTFFFSAASHHYNLNTLLRSLIAFIDYAKSSSAINAFCVFISVRESTQTRNFINLCILRHIQIYTLIVYSVLVCVSLSVCFVFVFVFVLFFVFVFFLNVCVIGQDWRINTHAGEYVHKKSSLGTCCSASFQFYTLALYPVLFCIVFFPFPSKQFFFSFPFFYYSKQEFIILIEK